MIIGSAYFSVVPPKLCGPGCKRCEKFCAVVFLPPNGGGYTPPKIFRHPPKQYPPYGGVWNPSHGGAHLPYESSVKKKVEFTSKVHSGPPQYGRSLEKAMHSQVIFLHPSKICKHPPPLSNSCKKP